jgi:hypothetical protein
MKSENKLAVADFIGDELYRANLPVDARGIDAH